jgi:hypothetical protein
MNIMPEIFEALDLEPFEYFYLQDTQGNLLEGEFSLSDKGDIIYMGKHLFPEPNSLVFVKILAGEYHPIRKPFCPKKGDTIFYPEISLLNIVYGENGEISGRIVPTKGIWQGTPTNIAMLRQGWIFRNVEQCKKYIEDHREELTGDEREYKAR